MNTLKPILSLLILSIFFSCTNTQKPEEKTNEPTAVEPESSGIKVLNFATFHMGYSSDAHTVEFDENNKKNKDTIHQVAAMLAAFKPTVIIVEATPEYNGTLQGNYATYLKDQDAVFENPDEIELLAFEVGRLAGTKRIYGVDHKMEYNYNIGSEIVNSIDSLTINNFQADPFKSIPHLSLFEEGLPLMERLKRINHPKMLDFLITANADILTYAGTENGFEGADEAAKYYQRNLRIYSNLNRLQLGENDRLFILTGGSHTAFLREFMERDEKYEMVNTFDYLK
ncbi:DUF5694 domain-containing protein [Flagellimonas nanhaiensis]|uniref:Uncharacterized protein n=1 Tax=Flagellimonas nanhaiensis TaxID=2292706 RepID=A0A371JV65_9FLAO|nr:DUF5694 domain-containing protein [Allomuricauda nanhaiensis]RDY61708.1 hypothetical protein DX873_06045 [Allomuricauda nanhaiensis]